MVAVSDLVVNSVQAILLFKSGHVNTFITHVIIVSAVLTGK